MTKKTSYKNKRLYLLIGILFILFISLFWLRVRQNPSYISPQQTQKTSSQKFYSKTLKLEIESPNGYKVEQDDTFIDLITNNGKLNISRIATNYDDISNYVKDFDSKRKIVVREERVLMINDLESITRIEKFLGGSIDEQKVYFIYVNNWVYSLSTSSPALYGDLDTIVQSFKYVP